MTFLRCWLRRGALGASLALATLASGRSDAAPPAPPSDPAARGLDVFLDGPAAAVPGAKLTFAAQAVGYRTVTDGRALPGATIAAAWDAVDAPDAKPVVATADASGRATLVIEMPRVKETAHLLVTTRLGGHERTRTFEVAARPARSVEVVVADPQVVPGTRVGAWIRVRDRSEGRKLEGVPVLVEMLDGGVARDRVRTTTDSTGSALVSLAVPTLPLGFQPKWQVRATLLDGSGSEWSSLAPREEVVAQPEISAAWTAKSAFSGDALRAEVRLRDAAGDPIAGETIEWVLTPFDPEEGSREETWERKKVATTDANGAFVIEAAAPTVAPGRRLSLQLQTRTTSFERTLRGSDVIEIAAQGSARLDAIPEGKSLVPGVAQHVLLRARGDDGKPLAGPAHVSADGLDVDVVLDARGEAEVVWTPPADVGSRRDVGGCARSVAASVTLTERSGRLAKRGNRVFDCAVVDRTREARLEVDPPVARAGDKVRVRVLAQGAAAKRPFVVSLAPRESTGTPRAVWIEDGATGADIELPAGPSGTWNLVAHAPRDGKPALEAAATILLAPKVLPKAAAKIVGGRLTPSGTVVVEVRLTDDVGKPLDGLVAGLVYDAFGGGSSEEIHRLDAHVVLCEAAGLEPSRCEDAWRGDAAAMALLRGGMGSFAPGGPVLSDPGGTAKAALEASFNETLRSLEGAVFEATSSPDRLIDARRDRGGARRFNPELFRIVTEALPTSPTTPGGEPLELADLVAVDPQVTFDNVAKRVTRLKVFRVLSAVRDYRMDNKLDLSEPALADPNLLLGVMTSRGTLDASALLDPWGGTMSFRKAGGGSAAPAIATLPGWELASPGPDGRLGSGDDVADPFARVVKSGTPYARALGEDAVVLARAELRVHEATMSGWSALLEEKTGTSLGNAGSGSGQGRLSGSHRTKPPSVRMGATSVDRSPREPVWSLPVRTKDGVARIELPLGAADTTYRVVLAGLSEGGDAAITEIDVPITTPVAAMLETGDKWTTGDAVEAVARVRNRTAKPLRLVATFAARGAAALERSARTVVDVPAHGSKAISARARATRAGEAVLELRLADESGKVVDAVHRTVTVVDPGRPVVRSRSRFVSGEAEIPAIALAADERPSGPPRIVVERGAREALLAALASLDPDRQSTPDALADAVEAASRIELFAKEEGPAADELLTRAASAKERAKGRLASRTRDARTVEARRAARFAPPEGDPPPPPCGDESLGDKSSPAARWLVEAEPNEAVGATSACWDSISEPAKRSIDEAGDPVALARLVSAFAERTHHREDAKLLAAKLATKVSLDSAGRVALAPPHDGSRESRAIVYAGLLRGAALGVTLPATKEALLGWLLVQRDGTGGFGSPLATRLAVTALIAVAPRDPAATTSARLVSITAQDDDDDPLGAPIRFDLSSTSPRAARAATLDARTESVLVAAPAPGAFVRLERTVLVQGRPSTEVFASPLRLEIAWPRDAKAGGVAKLEIRVRAVSGDASRVAIVVPLPPGVSLAESMSFVQAIPGALVVDAKANLEEQPLPLRIPLRFALAGEMAVPDASAAPRDASGEAVYAAAPRLVVGR